MVKHVFLHGKYLMEDFLPFIDSVISKFGFTIEYLHEENQASQNLGIPALYKHKNKIMQGNPQFIFVMNCDICSSFPLYDMLKFQDRTQALLTVMTTNDESDENHTMGAFTQNPQTNEMIHYTEGGKKSNLTVNCGVYLFSSELFLDKEFIKSLNIKEHDASRALHKKQLTRL